MPELIDGKIRGRAAAEVDEVRLASVDKRFRGVQAQFVEDRVDVSLDLRRILVGINLEIAEVAALPAKRKRGIIRDEVIADRGLLFQRRGFRSFGGNSCYAHEKPPLVSRMHWNHEPTPNPSEERSSTVWRVPLLGGVRSGFGAERFM